MREHIATGVVAPAFIDDLVRNETVRPRSIGPPEHDMIRRVAAVTPPPAAGADRCHGEERMLRLSELAGRPVVAQDAGAKVGDVADLLADGEHVVAIVLAGGILASEHVLPFSEVQKLGEDTVIAVSSNGVLDAKQWAKSGVTAYRLGSLRKKQVLTTSGHILGVIGDVYLDELGSITGYDVESRGFGGLVRRHQLLPAQGVTVGPNALVVSQEAATAFTAKDAR
jgi:uncharacterized protein YrrD